MRRLFSVGLFLAVATASACSLINAPADVIPGGVGGAASTSSQTSSGTGGQGGTECTGSADCAKLTDACAIGVCTAGMCVKTPDATKEGLACDDGLFCTTTDVCVAGACVGKTKVCPEASGTSSAASTGGAGAGDSTGGAASTGVGGAATTGGAGGPPPKTDACHMWSCNEALKTCEIVAGSPGSLCDDGEPCTTGETCGPSGMCGNGKPTDCSAKISECSSGKCTPGVGCQAVPENEGLGCNILNPCGLSTCVSGKCNIQMPKNTGATCDDGVYCTTSDVCQPSGFCSGAPTCADPTPCITSTCDEAGQKCMLNPKVTGEPCATSACSAGQTCNNNGVCGGGTVAATYFYENFANNNKGWLLGTEWGIASAAVSPTIVFGADPAQDNSPTADNGVAGVVIGGNENPVIHPPYYLESPVVDISAAQGQLYLTYYRWLNSDYTPYMRNMVEVFDGVAWQQVWTSGEEPGIQDSPPAGQGWTLVSHDLTAYKNTSFKVRFGYEILQTNAYTIGSWNLDDVKLQNTACPTVP